MFDFQNQNKAAGAKRSTVFRRFSRNEDGGVATFVAMSLPVILGFIGLGVEVSYWYQAKGRAQSISDYAAYSGGTEAELSPGQYGLHEMVALDTAANFGINPADVTVLSRETSLGTKVDVEVKIELKRLFSKMFDSSDLSTAGKSSAIVEAAGEACLVALDPNGGVVLSGNSSVDIDGCLLASNGTGSKSLEITGSGTLVADCAAVVGDADVKDGSATFSKCLESRTGAQPVFDPYAGVPIPTDTTSGFENCVSTSNSKGKGKNKNNAPLTTGRYCSDVVFSGDVEIEDGAILLLDGVSFENHSHGSITGNNVTIILTNNSVVDLGSQATMNLSAKTTGDYAGLIFVGDAATQDTTHKWNGGADSNLQGAVYLPTDEVEVRGGVETSSTGCLHFIAGSIDMRGNSGLKNNCESAGTKPLVVTGGVRLVER